MAKKRAPHPKAVRVLQNWLDWAHEMHKWGRQVRADIVRLETEVVKVHPSSAGVFQRKAKLLGKKPAPWQKKRKGDPGDPPPPPET
jgi:hypothetical protein